MYDYTGSNWSHRNSNKRFKEKNWQPYKDNIHYIHYKRQLYLEHHIQYGKYCTLKLEACVVGITAGSREVTGRKGLWQEIVVMMVMMIMMTTTTTTTMMMITTTTKITTNYFIRYKKVQHKH
jgi:hypothetical protein